jgi:NAD(P)-dependent dehydrogenase (short-subunit alcohol dehydrogenase family)
MPAARSEPEVVVITGATSGVGRATSERFARDGASVALLARGQDGLEGAAKAIESRGGTALPVPLDVADPDQVEAAAAMVEDRLGPIDIWINSAMTTVFGEVGAVSGPEFRRVMEVNYLGTVNGTLAALARMQARDRGSIVQVGSALAYRAIPLQAPYCASKHAVQGFTQSLRCELLHQGSPVRLTIVHLPGLNTPQFDRCESRMPKKARPVAPIYQPEVAARAIHWAAHHNRREVWVGGSTVATILANRVAPGMLDRYLARTNYQAQQDEEPEDPNRSSNLWTPVAGDPGAHGRFDDSAHHRSLQLQATMRRGVAVLGAAAAGLSAALARTRRQS